jgi:hypothetical protein
MSGLDDAKDDFDKWVGKWDQALEKGIFKDAPKPPSTAPETSDQSFFGFRQDNPTDSINSSDSDYWRAISSVADGGIDFQRLDEADEKDGPNPVRKGTDGPDSELTNKAVSATFNEDDVKKLEEMKVKLHELENKIAEMGEKSYSDQVKALLAKIEELSNKMGRIKD